MKDLGDSMDNSTVINSNKLAAIRAEIIASGLPLEVCDVLQSRIDDADIIFSLSQIDKPSAEETVQAVRTIAKCFADKLAADVRGEVRSNFKLRQTIREAITETVPIAIKDAFDKMDSCPVKSKTGRCSWRDTAKLALTKSPMAIAIIIGALAISNKMNWLTKLLGF
jgi:hypothetical protein